MDSTNDSRLRNARFLRPWIGQGTSFLGDAVSMVALVVLVVQVTGTASAVGGALIARLLPTLASPLAGVRAGRLSERGGRGGPHQGQRPDRRHFQRLGDGRPGPRRTAGGHRGRRSCLR